MRQPTKEERVARMIELEKDWSKSPPYPEGIDREEFWCDEFAARCMHEKYGNNNPSKDLKELFDKGWKG